MNNPDCGRVFRVVLGLTGGIACYKSVELVRLMRQQGWSVSVVMTEAAQKFITPLTMQAVSGERVLTEAWDLRISNAMPHIELGRGIDAIVIAPASADFIQKLAQGCANDVLSTVCLARDVPLLVAPAMNRQMWHHPATQRNIEQLRADGVIVLGPAEGEQACGEVGLGRMLEPVCLLAAIDAHFQTKLLQGKRVLVTAGPTFEPIDPVRGLTNLSSGKMGYAIARAAMEAGADVELISGPTALSAPWNVRITSVLTAQQMYDEVMRRVGDADIFIAVAAVADYRVEYVAVDKLKKELGLPVLTLVENPDILAEVAKRPQPPFCVGFAAESCDLEVHAQEKRIRKGIPLLAANWVQTALGQDSNSLVLFDANGIYPLAKSSKLAQARALIQHVVGLL